MSGRATGGRGRLVRVTPAPANRLPGDEPREIDPRAAAADRAAPAILGQDRPASPGRPRTIEVVIDGWRFELEVEDARLADLRDRATVARGARTHDGPTEVRAIIPGRVLSVAVVVGDVVTAGQRLLAVEAMKMENELRAPRDGTVERIAVAVGETVDPGDPLVVLR
jgi:biotin carboxyl carrier protein